MKILVFILLAILSLISIIYLSLNITKDIKDKPIEILNKSIFNEETKLTFSGWLPYWDYDKALLEAINNKDKLNSISPFIYVLNSDGQIVSKISEDKIKNTISNYEGEIIPTISNEFDPKRVSNIINSENETKNHINDISNIVNNYNYSGIEIDYEYLKSDDKQAFSNFIKDLSLQLHNDKKILIVTLHAKTGDVSNWDSANAQDWKQIAKYADFIRIMVYDNHYSESEPGPIAPYDWSNDVSKYASQNIPKDKLIMGIGLYGYDWSNQNTTKNITLDEANKLINKYNLSESYDKEYKSPFINYIENDIEHEVWYENKESFLEKYTIAKKYYSGISIWRLGGIPEEFYSLLVN